jgi:putative flavoprotein involved in K+ transport
VDEHEVAVIGAGQAGLAIGYFLAQAGRRFVIVDRATSIAAAWQERWDSLTLFTPRRYSSLPGMPFPGEADGYPMRDEVISYLHEYADTFKLPVELGCEVTRLDADGDRFVLETGGRTVVAGQVVVATGPFQAPFVPGLGEGLAADVFQVHSTGYRRPADVPRGTALVVGGGNTGFQIAKELSSARKVILSVGSRQTPLPQRILGRDLFWWLTKTGALSKTVESRLGRRLQHRETLIGSSSRELERKHGVDLKPRAVRAEGRTVGFGDDSEAEVDAVIWATGYRADYAWIKLPVFDEGGRVRHRRGVTDVTGLYFLGLSWQYTRGSALIGWVKDDARYLADRIAAREQRKRSSAGTQPLATAMRVGSHGTEEAQ